MTWTVVTFALFHMWLVGSYLLGEEEGDPNWMRCWQEGTLMTACPDGLWWNWNMTQEETWYEGEEYIIRLNLTFSDEFRAKVLAKDDAALINHLNIHSCKFDLGKVCIPFMASSMDGVTHTGVISGEDHGSFDSSVSLTEGMWNVIGHGRLYLVDDTFYPLEGSTGCSGNNSELPSPWKLDFAIGTPHQVLPPLEEDTTATTSIQGWKIIVVLVCVVGALGLVYRFYKHYSSQEKEVVRETAEQALKKALVFECVSLGISFGLATFDWLTDVLAMVSVQQVDDLNQMLVVMYFGMIVLISSLYFYVTYSAVIDIMAVMREYRHGLDDQLASNVVAMDDKEEPLNRKKSGKINYEFSRVRRSITGEKITGIMGLIEDVPMFVFNAALIFHYGVDESMLMISFITNAVILGYKFSGIERLWYLLQIKTKVDSMVYAVRISRTIKDIGGNTQSQLMIIENALVNDEMGSEEPEGDAIV